PYMVFTPYIIQGNSASDSAILLNLDTRKIDLLSNDVDWAGAGNCCRFTEDGQRLRYPVITGENETQTLVLRERVLATGEEKVLYTETGTGLGLYPDGDGERWLLYEQKPGSTLHERLDTIRILHSDGTSEQIYQHSTNGFGFDDTTYEFV